jgi:hypothetical protein
MSSEVLSASYVDRGELDELLKRELERGRNHVCLRGESKCGKSWLRQRVLPDAIVVQCRLGKTTVDIYRDALAQLGIRLEVERVDRGEIRGSVRAEGSVGIKLLAKVGLTSEVSGAQSHETTTRVIGGDFTDLRFIAEVLKESDRKLVIEDFHYLSIAEREVFSFDLKTLWDYGVQLVIIGVWTKQNMLMYLNQDLTGRVVEIPIVWSEEDLSRVFRQGGEALNISFSDNLQGQAITDCYENVGIMQTNILLTLDELDISEARSEPTVVEDVEALEAAALQYADQLNPVYQQFAERVSSGIRTRQDSTGIYAHAMAVILTASDESLLQGLSIDHIYGIAHGREPRIQKSNLATILERIEGLQVDDDGRGLMVAYNEALREVSVVDRQLLLYRKYSTVNWPWEELIKEAESRTAAGGDSFLSDSTLSLL